MQARVEPIYKYRYAYPGNNDKISTAVSMHPEVSHLIGLRAYAVFKSLDSDAFVRRASCIEAKMGHRRIISKSAGRDNEQYFERSPMILAFEAMPGLRKVLIRSL